MDLNHPVFCQTHNHSLMVEFVWVLDSPGSPVVINVQMSKLLFTLPSVQSCHTDHGLIL